MASDLSANAGELAKPDAVPVEQRIDPAPPSPPRAHRTRFFVIYGILGLAVAASILGLVVYAGRSIDPGPAWSSWKPSGGGLGAAKQIAAHVAPGYRLPDGNQLVEAIPKGPVLTSGGQTAPLSLIALRGPKGKIQGDSVVETSNENTLTFSLCGLGQSCAIATGKPSVERATLVRREILELALYTFKYVPGVKRIVAFMPPPTGTPPTYVVYLTKEDLKRQLDQPLAETIAAKTPLPKQITPKEAQRIDALTLTKMYKFGVSQTQQGELVLVLQPIKA